MRCIIAKVLQDEVVLLSREGEFRTVSADWVEAHLPAGSPGFLAGQALELPWPPPEAATATEQPVNAGAGHSRHRWQTALRSTTARWGALAAAAVLALALVPRALAPQNQALVAIDINPSLELTVDRQDRVTGATPRNDDARRVLAGLALKGQPLEAATDEVLQRVIALGYLAPGKDNVVLAAVVPLKGGNTPDVAALQSRMAAQLQAAGLNGYVSARLVDAPVRAAAQKAGLSVNQELVRRAIEQQGAAHNGPALAGESPREALQAAGLDVKTVFPDGQQVGEEGSTSPDDSAAPESVPPATAGEDREEPATTDSGKTAEADSERQAAITGTTPATSGTREATESSEEEGESRPTTESGDD